MTTSFFPRRHQTPEDPPLPFQSSSVLPPAAADEAIEKVDEVIEEAEADEVIEEVIDPLETATTYEEFRRIFRNKSFPRIKEFPPLDTTPWERTPEHGEGRMIFIEMDIPFAIEVLRRNRLNRGIADGRVELYAGKQRRSEWMVNGETGKLGLNGLTQDFQHRAMTVLKTGIPMRMWVCVDLDPRAQKTQDRGRGRSKLDDRLVDADAPQFSPNVAQAARHLGELLDGSLPANRRWQVGTHGAIATTIEQDTAIYLAHPGLSESEETLKGWSRTVNILKPALILSHYVLHSIDQDTADLFFERLTTGVGFNTIDDPILKVRNYFGSPAPRGRRSDAKPQADERKALAKPNVRTHVGVVFKTWNYWVAGQEVKGGYRVRTDELFQLPTGWNSLGWEVPPGWSS